MHTDLMTKKGPGRTRLPPSDRKVPFNFSCSPNEYGLITKKAINAGLSVSAYMVKCALEAS